MKEELLSIKGSEERDISFIPMALHLYPDKLKDELQTIINNSKEYERIILAFGLCGGAMRDIYSEDSILTIPRVHDCIPIFLGSRSLYESMQKENKGTYYLTGGWINGEKSILEEYERVLNKFGEKRAKKVFSRMYDSYHNIKFIHTDYPNKHISITKSKEIARILDLNYEEMKGDSSFIEKVLNGPWDGADFINLPINHKIKDEDFIR